MNAITQRAHLIASAFEELDAIIVPEVPDWFHVNTAIRM